MANSGGGGGDTAWVGKKPLKRLGGMADALQIASDLGFSLPPQDDVQNLGNTTGFSDKSDSLVKVLRDLTSVQRNLANLQVELQGRQDDNSVAHLTHVSEMEKKCQTLAKTTAILKDVIQNKDRIIARLQQPYSIDCLPVEAEYQRQFSELLLKAASDYGALTTAIADFQWSQSFKDPPSIWAEILRPIPVALASCTRYFEAVSAMRESIADLHKSRVGSSCPVTPLKEASWMSDQGDSVCATPPPWNATYSMDEPSSDDVVIRSRKRLEQLESLGENTDFGMPTNAGQPDHDSLKQRRLSWPPQNIARVI
ncbi:hypothetical protein SUGI_0631950 [Cryptomeria japonica]|nr:hypothetical protein SUGI_0631950 [Cryptomeria japonica]